MLRRFSLLFFAVALLPVLLHAQDKMILKPDGKFIRIHGNESTFEIMKVKPFSGTNETQFLNKIPGTVTDVTDTLRYSGLMNTNFGFFGQDRMVQWFVAPADMTIQQVAWNITDDTGLFDIELKLVNINLTEDELLNAPVEWDGYYEALGNGYNDITAYLDDPDRTGGWVSMTGDPEPFGNDLWSDGGFGLPITPVNTGVHEWADLSILGYPNVTLGDRFGVSFKNQGPNLDEDRIGFLSGIVGFPGWKFYANGRLDPGVDYGWWSREYTWDFWVEVVLTGDRPPVFNSYTQLGTTTDTGDRQVDANVTDDNPSGGPFGVDHVSIWWTNDGAATWNEVVMTGTEPDFTGMIPGQPGGTEVSYYLEATDVEGLTSQTLTTTYQIFAPSGAPTLVVYNNFDDVDGYPQDYYFGPDLAPGGTFTFDHDEWAYGPLPAGILDTYTNVIEICNGGPVDDTGYNDDVVRTWLDADGSHNYYLAGQEWLGVRYGFADMDFVAGDFEFDVLGINHSYNDVSYDGTSGQELPSLVTPMGGTMFGDPLLTLFNSLDPPADSLMYNPVFEIGESNWIDAYEVEGDVEVDMTTETRGIGGVPAVETHPTMSHRTLTGGNKIVYAAYDPLSLNTAIDNSYPYYHWVSYDNSNSPYQALVWFGVDIISDVREVGGVLPDEFTVSQNYPNPFNPTTTINFSVPNTSKVILKVYDILGSEVATLFDGVKNAGNYEVSFDASNLASGMYIYTINAGSFTSSKKMMLMK